MTRLLVLAALGVVLWMFLEIGWARLKRGVGAGRPMPPMPGMPGKLPEIALVRCAGCGVHVPRGRVVGGKCEQCRLTPGVETPG
jgi:hypothetical protein